MMYDCNNLIANATFRTKISPGLYWVPFNIFGFPTRTTEECKKLISLSPHEKQIRINNIYDAVQLFQVSQFVDELDVIFESIENQLWEFHKPGILSVKDNHGCCSSAASWLNYMIDLIYPEKGYISFLRPDNTGHVINYILYNGIYYIIDMSSMAIPNVSRLCPETGVLNDYLAAKVVTGVCFETNDLNNFVKFHSKIQKYRGYLFHYYMTNPLEYFPTSLIPRQKTTIYLYEGQKLLEEETPELKYEYIKPPNYSPNWTLRQHICSECYS